jgi:hypothetical protein
VAEFVERDESIGRIRSKLSTSSRNLRTFFDADGAVHAGPAQDPLELEDNPTRGPAEPACRWVHRDEVHMRRRPAQQSGKLSRHLS